MIHAIVDLDGEIAEADGYLKAMETCVHTIRMDTRHVTPPEIVFYLSSFQSCFDKLQHMKTLFNNHKTQYQKSLTVVSKSPQPSSSSSSSSDAASLHESTRMLEESRRILHQSHSIGHGVITDLEQQKESLLSSQDHVQQTTHITYDARAMLNQMRNKTFFKKAVLGLVIFILAIVIVLVTYYGVFRK